MSELLEVEIGPPAHGGHCVARADGRVVFVRHTLPGERVRVRLTEGGPNRRFWRGDAVEVIEPSPDRVPSVWPEAGPGGVGGGELAHVALRAQRAWKTAVVHETLRRIGHIDLADVGLGDVVVEALPGDDERGGLATRTRIELVIGADGRAGMHAHRSHEVLPLTAMPLAVDAIAELDLFAGPWAGAAPGTRLEIVAPSQGEPLVLADGEPAGDGAALRSGPPAGRGGAGEPGTRDRRGGRDHGGRTSRKARRPAAPPRVGVREVVPTPFGELTYRVSAAGFWQVHREAPSALVGAVLAAAEPQEGERVLDLYSGAGLFTVPLARAVGPTGRVDAVEGDERAVKDARRNLHAHPNAVLHAARVEAGLGGVVAAGGRADVVVLDPPRSGAGAPVMAALAGLGPRRIVYVACDPAALARDVRAAGEHGYALRGLRALDLFPHTHHVECVAVLERD